MSNGPPLWWLELDVPMQQYIEKLAKAAFEEGAHDVPSDAAKDMGYSPIHAAIVKAGPPPRKS